MDEIATCGAGIAQQSRLHTRLAAVATAIADVLEQHLRALSPDDPAARPEREADVDLVASTAPSPRRSRRSRAA
jgi:hypothetical protein